MIDGSAIEFVEDTLNQLRVEEKKNQDLIIRIGEEEKRTHDAEAKLWAAKNNLFSVQRKLYAAVTLINDVYRDYRDLNFKTKAGRKRADQVLEQMRRFQQEHDIHIEDTERGWVAK